MWTDHSQLRQSSSCPIFWPRHYGGGESSCQAVHPGWLACVSAIPPSTLPFASGAYYKLKVSVNPDALTGPAIAEMPIDIVTRHIPVAGRIGNEPMSRARAFKQKNLN
ncbi:hypothetical protein KCU81_g6279, partial [Aureobasidium melanogenum]